MEKIIIIKSEIRENGDMYIYYVDENGDPIEIEEGMEPEINKELIQNLKDHKEVKILQKIEQSDSYDGWSDEEIRKLLDFYTVNRKSFLSGQFTKRHLWSVACQLTLCGKNPAVCELQINALKKKYNQLRNELLKSNCNPNVWPYYELCHNAFQVGVDNVEDADNIKKNIIPFKSPANTALKKKKIIQDEKKVLKIEKIEIEPRKKHEDGIDNVEDADCVKTNIKDSKNLSNTPLEKKETIQNEKDVLKIGKIEIEPKEKHIDGIDNVEDADNVKTNIKESKSLSKTLREKKKEMQNEKEVHKNNQKEIEPKNNSEQTFIKEKNLDWNEAQKYGLVKFYADNFNKFQDLSFKSVPIALLWDEVGKLLSKSSDDCEQKYEELRYYHITQYNKNVYNLHTRKPIDICFDDIISREVEKNFSDPAYKNAVTDLQWKAEKVDELVQFFLQNIELFKDPVCYFVCWFAVAVKLKETVKACKDVWDDLTNLYNVILEDRKEDSDMQIDWRYVDSFDKIFDNGSDTKLLAGYENKDPVVKKKGKKARRVQYDNQPRITEGAILTRQRSAALSKFVDKAVQEENVTSSSDFEEINIVDQLDPRALKLLEYYAKKKGKYPLAQRGKPIFWEPLVRELQMTSSECAAKFKSIKVLFVENLQKEVNRPELPILWPYFSTCKKIFGFQKFVSKLKRFREYQKWEHKDIKHLVRYAKKNLIDIETHQTDATKWRNFRRELRRKRCRTMEDCRDMFFTLKDCYLKIKSMKKNKPDFDVQWKYYHLFDDLYSNLLVEDAEYLDEDFDNDDNVDDTVCLDDNVDDTEFLDDNVDDTEGLDDTGCGDNEGSPVEINDEEEYDCIIVVPEGELLSEQLINDSKLVIKNKIPLVKEPIGAKRVHWGRKEQIELCEAYRDYIKQRGKKVVNNRVLWDYISTTMNRSPRSCKMTYNQLKRKYAKFKEEGIPQLAKYTPVFKVLEEIYKLKPKLLRPTGISFKEVALVEKDTYQDVVLPLWKVEIALKYYLEHLEEFVNPIYDKTEAWVSLAKVVSVPTVKVFKKINFLKQFYDSETGEVEGKPFEYCELLHEIVEKELSLKATIGDFPDPLASDENTDDVTWTDSEIQELSIWYLENLEKFLNPKYNQNYLWLDAADILNKSPLACAMKMEEIQNEDIDTSEENPKALKTKNMKRKINKKGKNIKKKKKRS